MPRKIRVKIEMDLIEGQDFKIPNNKEDFVAIAVAEASFVGMLNSKNFYPFDWIQSRLITDETDA